MESFFLKNLLLNKEKVKAAFPDDPKFHDAADAQFKSDKEWYAYDQFHKIYKSNWIIKEHS